LLQLDADIVLVGIGRRPYTDGLGLQDIGVEVSPKGPITISKQFQSNIPSVWAIGDVVEGPMLAHKAEEEGIAVASLIAARVSNSSHTADEIDYSLIPSVVYTHPEVAWVGRGEGELQQAGIKYNVGKFPFMANSRAKANGTLWVI
jgi:dihydrolipoamide dehydrogenase